MSELISNGNSIITFSTNRQCTGGKGDSLIPTDMADEFDAGEFPSLEQVLEHILTLI